MSYASSNQLNNITNNNIISNSKQWRKPDLLARSATRELELQQKLKASTSSSANSQPSSQQQQQQSSQTPLGASLKENGASSSSQSKTELKRTLSTTSNTSSSQGTAAAGAASETTNKKKKFASFKFYLDTLDPNDQAKIERGIKLLGATQEQFFSKKCTHLITTKNIPVHENMLSSSQNSDTSKQTRKTTTAKDTIVQNALSWGISLWSKDVMLKTIDYLMKQSPAKYNRQQTQGQPEKRGLGKVLQEEKLFGPSTGANSEAQAKRPHFVAFTGHYLIIEDASQTNRPVVAKQYTKTLLPHKRGSDYPWPFFKTTPPLRSPFGKRAPPPPPPPANTEKKEDKDAATAGKKDEQDNGDSQQPTKQMDALKVSTDTKTPPETPLATPLSTPPITTAASTNTTTTAPTAIAAVNASGTGMAAGILPFTPISTPVASTQTPPVTPGGGPLANKASLAIAAAGITNPDSQNSLLRASGFQPSLTTNNIASTTRSVSTSVSTMQNDIHKRLPPGESVNRLDKRMVENIARKTSEHQKMHKQAVKGAEKAQAQAQAGGERGAAAAATAEGNNKNRDQNATARKEKEKKKDLRYCENCNCQFENLEEHMNDQTHQTFIRDQNNFKELDQLLERTHRMYKEPLPDRFKSLIDVNIDGKHVKFVSDTTSPSSSPTSTTPQKRSRSTTTSSTSLPATVSTAEVVNAVAPNKLSTALMQSKQSNKAIESPRIMAENKNLTATAMEGDTQEGNGEEPEQKKEGWDKFYNVFLS